MRGRTVAVLLAIGAILTLTPATLADPDETTAELQKQIEALTRRVEALERQLQAARAPQPAPPVRPVTASATAGRDEALALYRKVDGLVATGNVQQAHRELDAYNQKYAGTNAAAWTRSLSRELEVVGKEAPVDWSIEKWYQGEGEVTLDGSRPTLVVFWEAWCPHCREEVPKLQELYEAYKGEGLQVVGVTRLTRTATDESVEAFLQESQVTYPIAKETGDLAGYFNVKGIPAAALVENGKIVWRGHPIRLTNELMHIWF
jgi:thiol-disulfide isomerase/thioredoxin